MGFWDMLQTPRKPKGKSGLRSATPTLNRATPPTRSVSPSPMSEIEIASSSATIPTAAFPSLSQVSKLEIPTSPTPSAKRKAENGDEGSKRSRTTVKVLTETRSSTPLHLGAITRSPSVHRQYTLTSVDSSALQSAQETRSAAETAELAARSELAMAQQSYNDWIVQKTHADEEVAGKDAEVAALLAAVEVARKERDGLHERATHLAGHLNEAEAKVVACSEDVTVKTAAAKAAAREYAVVVRGD